jgi:hypothetical protein
VNPNEYLFATLSSLDITEDMLVDRRQKFVRGNRTPEVGLYALAYGPATVAAIVELVIEAREGKLACAA